jgi:rubredoxin
MSDNPEAYKSYKCVICGFIYNEAEGIEGEIDAGTRWKDVPEDWLCPDCAVGKSDFEMVEI